MEVGNPLPYGAFAQRAIRQRRRRQRPAKRKFSAADLALSFFQFVFVNGHFLIRALVIRSSQNNSFAVLIQSTKTEEQRGQSQVRQQNSQSGPNFDLDRDDSSVGNGLEPLRPPVGLQNNNAAQRGKTPKNRQHSIKPRLALPRIGNGLGTRRRTLSPPHLVLLPPARPKRKTEPTRRASNSVPF